MTTGLQAGLDLLIDHVGFVVHDLRPLLELFRALGFRVTEPDELMGASEPLGQRSAHTIFERGYLEFTAPTGANPDNHLYPLLDKHEGVQILALGTQSAGASLLSLNPDILAHQNVMEASREVSYGPAAGRARFHWFALDPQYFQEALVCYAEHLTPEVVFQHEVSQQPNTVVALTGIAIAASPEELAHYEQLRSGASKIPDHIHPDGRVYPCQLEHLRPAGHRAPWICAVDFLLRDLTAFRDILAAASIEITASDEKRISIDCAYLHCRLNFHEAP